MRTIILFSFIFFPRFWIDWSYIRGTELKKQIKLLYIWHSLRFSRDQNCNDFHFHSIIYGIGLWHRYYSPVQWNDLIALHHSYLFGVWPWTRLQKIHRIKYHIWKAITNWLLLSIPLMNDTLILESVSYVPSLSVFKLKICFIITSINLASPTIVLNNFVLFNVFNIATADFGSSIWTSW